MKAKDLARQLGVSPATISLVPNNKPGISDTLRRSLLKKIRELGCGDMIGAAQDSGNYASQRPHPVIAYLIYTSCDETDDRFAFYPAVLEGAEMEARENGFHLVVMHLSRQGNPQLQSLLEDVGDTAGVIIQAGHISAGILEDVRSLRLPAVFVDAYLPNRQINSVCVNNEQGVFTAVRYLKEKGHRDLGYVYSGQENDSQVDRRRCFHQALWEYGLEDRKEFYFSCADLHFGSSADELSLRFQKVKPFPTALLAENDHLAWQAIKALEQAGLRVPEDVSVIGFDNRSLCTMITPRLTSMKNSRRLMGRECISLLQNLCRLRRLGIYDACLNYQISTQLIERDSVRDLTKTT